MTAADPNTGQIHEDLYQLSRPFPEEFIERKENADYVAHPIVNQRLLSIVGPFDFELVREIRGDVSAVPPDEKAKSRRGKAGTPELRNVVTGGVWRLTAEIDGRRVRVEEVGDVDPHNNSTDGARLKESASDALKRCAMRLGLGLHLWSKGHYFLDQQLAAPPQDQPTAAPQESKPGGAGAPNALPDATPADADTAKAPDPSPGPVADGTPPGSDAPRFGGPGAARSWLRHRDQDELRPLVEETLGGTEHVGEASLDDLQAAIDLAFRKASQVA